MKIVTSQNLLKANDKLAAENRRRLQAAGVFMVNVASASSGWPCRWFRSTPTVPAISMPA